MAKKVQLKYVLSGTLTEINPRTSADNVLLNDGTTVEATLTTMKSTLSSLVSRVNIMEDKLDFDTVYMTDGNGTILNDGSGTNLVAVY